MNLSSGNLANSLESSSSLPSSPELMNNGTASTTGGNSLSMNSPCISHGSSMVNGDVMKLSPNHHHHHPHHPQNHHSSHNHHHHQNQHNEESRSALSSSSTSSTMLPGGLSMNHLSNPLIFPFPPNFLLQESFNLIYHTCLNMFEKRLTEELEQFHQKYDVLLRECSETRFRLNKVENILRLFEEKFHPANFPFFFSGYLNPASLKSQPVQRYQEQQQHQQQQQQNLNEMNDANLLNSLKSVESAWLYSWKEYESLSNSFNSAHSNASPNSLLTSMSATVTATTTTQGDQQQSQLDQRQKIHSLSSKYKENNLEQFSIHRLSNSETQSPPPAPPPTTTTPNDATNLQLSTLNESFTNRIHNSSCNLSPALLPSLPVSLPSNNRQLMWNQWMANFMASSSCMNSTNGLLSSSSTSSLTIPSTLNNSERINSLNTSDIEINEGNQHKSPRLYPPVFFSNYEFNPNDLLNINRKSTSSIASSLSPSAPAPSSSSSSLRFRGSKFGRLKTKCLNSNRCQQNCTYSNNRLHLCHNSKSNHYTAGISTSALKNIRRSAMNFNNCQWALSGSPPPPPSPMSSSTIMTDQSVRSSLLGGDLQHSGSNGMMHSTASNSRSSHHHHHHHNNSSNHNNNNNNQNNNLIDRPVVILNPDEPREIFIGGVQSVSLPLWAYCKCLTMVRGEPHELGPRLCLRLLQSLFSLHYLVTHNYNGSGGKAPIDPVVMSAVLRQAQLQFGSGYFFTEPMALGKLRDYLNNAFRVMAFRQRKGERVRSPFWNDKGEPIHDLEAPVEFANITDIIVIPPHTNSTAATATTSVNMTTQTATLPTTTRTTTTPLTNEIEMNRNSR